MGKTSNLDSALRRILISPNPDDLWKLQTALLAAGGETALRARDIAGEFYSFLRNLESKIASRSASRWGAVLETASVTSVGLQEMFAEQQDPLKRLLASGVTAMLEVGAAVKNVQAWEVESSLVYHDVAWYLYGELWDVSHAARPELSSDERAAMIDQLLRPITDDEVDEAVKSVLLVRLFQIALTARVVPLLTGKDARE
jgi:hypothetical protein